MSKTVTIRLSNQDYKTISSVAKHERRPISNFITHRVMTAIADMNTVDDTEMKEILSDEKVIKNMKGAKKQFEQGKGRFVV
jgi:uncharacterized protein (DUF1778 family)